MKSTIIYPSNKYLKKYIKYFLFLKNDDPTYGKSHISYPNTNHCLGLLKNVKIVHKEENELTVLEKDGYHSYLTGIYTKPLKFCYNGVFDEICIDFEPLGLEVIAGKKLSNQKLLISVIEKFFAQEADGIYSAAFSSEEPFKRVEMLESFFIQLFNKQNEKKFIPFNAIYAETVKDLINKYNLSYRSVHRLYKDNLGITPKEFLNITKLRKNFTELNNPSLLLNHSYYDQSHLIRNYKKYTGQTPNNFKNTSQLIDNNVWLSII